MIGAKVLRVTYNNINILMRIESPVQIYSRRWEFSTDNAPALAAIYLSYSLPIHSFISVPNEDCKCGIYGSTYYNLLLINYAADIQTHRVPVQVMLGRLSAYEYITYACFIIEATGKTIEHEFGFRAEYAKVIGVVDIFNWGRPIEKLLSEEFKIPLIAHNEVQALITEHNELQKIIMTESAK